MPTGRELMTQAQHSMPSTSTLVVSQALETGQDIFILDVRERDEWEEGHIKEAIHLARGRLEGRIEELIPDKDVLIVCH